MNELTPYIFILIGIVCVLLPILQANDKSGLKQSGQKAEGIIFRFEGSQHYAPSGLGRTGNTVFVRFLTKTKEWITEPINQPFQLTSANRYKEGETVELYYDPSNPKNFFVVTQQNPLGGKLLFVLVGLVFAAIGVCQLFL